MIRKGNKVYFKVGEHKGYRKGVVISVHPRTLNTKRKIYNVFPTDEFYKKPLKNMNSYRGVIYGVSGSKIRKA